MANDVISDFDQLVEDLERHYLINDYRFVRAAIEAYVTARVKDVCHRAVTVADEAFGPFPVQTADEAMTEIERGIFTLRQRLESARAEAKHWCDHATKLVADLIAADERAATAVHARRTCTCLGECRGADGLGPGWVCALVKP